MISKYLRNAAFLLALVSSMPSMAQNQCSGIHSGNSLHWTPLDPQFLNENANPLRRSTRKESVQIVGSKKITPDAELRFLKARKKMWDSKYTHGEADLMGNPLWFALMTGPAVAAKFGFHQVSPEMISAPNAGALNQAIGQFNHLLKSQSKPALAVTFYETDLHQPLSGEAYLENFVQGKIPLEKSGSLAIHDLSFHVPSLLFPKWFLKRMENSSQWVLRFVHFLRQKAQDPLALKLADGLIERTVSKVDLLGNLTTVMSLEALEKDSSDAYANLLSAYVGEGQVHPQTTAGVFIQYSGANLSPADFIRFFISDDKLALPYLREFLHTDQGSLLLTSSQQTIPPDVAGNQLKADIRKTIENLKDLLGQ